MFTKEDIELRKFIINNIDTRIRNVINDLMEKNSYVKYYNNIENEDECLTTGEYHLNNSYLKVFNIGLITILNNGGDDVLYNTQCNTENVTYDNEKYTRAYLDYPLSDESIMEFTINVPYENNNYHVYVTLEIDNENSLLQSLLLVKILRKNRDNEWVDIDPNFVIVAPNTSKKRSMSCASHSESKIYLRVITCIANSAKSFSVKFDTVKLSNLVDNLTKNVNMVELIKHSLLGIFRRVITTDLNDKLLNVSEWSEFLISPKKHIGSFSEIPKNLSNNDLGFLYFDTTNLRLLCLRDITYEEQLEEILTIYTWYNLFNLLPISIIA